MFKHLSIAQTPIKDQETLRELLHNPVIDTEEILFDLSIEFIENYLYRKPRDVSESDPPRWL